MAFDIKEFLIAVVAIVIGAYILNYLGILKHTSPARARGGIGSNVPRNGYNRGMGIPQSVYPVGPVMVPRGAGAGAGVAGGGRVMNNVGPTEPRSANMSKSIGGRPFVT